MNTTIVDQHIIHFEVSTLARLRVLEFDECILQRITRHPIPDDLTANDPAKATEYYLQILVTRHRIQFAHEQHVFRRCHLGIRQISDNLKNRCPRLRLPLLQHLGNLLVGFPLRIVDVLVCPNAAAFQSLGVRRRRPTRFTESTGIFKGIFQNDGMRYPYILVGSMARIANRLIQHAQHILALGHLTDHAMHSVQRREVLAERQEELRSNQPVAQANHGQQTRFRMPDLWLIFAGEEALRATIDDAPNGFAAITGAARVSGLRNESVFDGVEEIEVVILEAAQLQEIEAGSRSLLHEQVDRKVAGGCFDDHGHCDVH